ncbi:MAG: hypothetical protein H0T60_14005 [Acidobacteria bacterium]|nr:hypothetical protein [Acidobacteriota bacterium]
MKNIKLSRIFKLSLLILAANFFNVNNQLMSNAQTKSTAPKLEGTVWQMEALPYVGVEAIYFEFRTRGRVSFTEVKSSIPTPETEIGTYRLSGNVIQMEFAEFSVKATLKGNLIEGEGTSKNTNAKMKFLITRVTSDTKVKGSSQNNSTKCEWRYKYVWRDEYNPVTKQYENQYVHRFVYDCGQPYN